MGMDFRPRKEVEPLHLNWSGWRTTLNLLGALGQDLSKASGSNDGYYIPAKHCRSWAKALKDALNDGKLCMNEDDDIIVVERKSTQICIKDRKPITQRYREWILKTIEFFDKCGGCWQY